MLLSEFSSGFEDSAVLAGSAGLVSTESKMALTIEIGRCRVEEVFSAGFDGPAGVKSAGAGDGLDDTALFSNASKMEEITLLPLCLEDALVAGLAAASLAAGAPKLPKPPELGLVTELLPDVEFFF